MLHLRENLYLGNINAAEEVLVGGNKEEITHILSVLSSPSIEFFSRWKSTFSVTTKNIRTVYLGSEWGYNKIHYVLENAGHDLKLVRMAVPLKDVENENLLDYLEVCLDFIDQGRKNGSVLVHCFAGISRSASIITAYLMRTERLSLQDALESLRQSKAYVCPNDGFLEQLTMFQDMGFKVDHSSTIYKRFRLKALGPGTLLWLWILDVGKSLLRIIYRVLMLRTSDYETIRPLPGHCAKQELSQAPGDSYNRGDRIGSSKFAADPGLTKKEASLTETMPAFRCKKCRRIVALQENVIKHVNEEGESSFECTSIFVEPLSWMKTAEEGGALEGKLWCTHCEEQLGYFNRSGIQCSCGSWITPAFQLYKSRIDISTL